MHDTSKLYGTHARFRFVSFVEKSFRQPTHHDRFQCCVSMYVSGNLHSCSCLHARTACTLTLPSCQCWESMLAFTWENQEKVKVRKSCRRYPIFSPVWHPCRASSRSPRRRASRTWGTSPGRPRPPSSQRSSLRLLSLSKVVSSVPPCSIAWFTVYVMSVVSTVCVCVVTKFAN